MEKLLHYGAVIPKRDSMLSAYAVTLHHNVLTIVCHEANWSVTAFNN